MLDVYVKMEADSICES